MRVVVISAQVFICPPPGYSGLEMIAWQTAKGLAACGHDVSLVAPNGSFCPGAKVIESGPPGQWDEQKAFTSYHEKIVDADAIIDHSWVKYSYSLKMNGKTKAPVLGVCHAPVNTMYQSLPPGVDKPCFVCISKDQANHFEALFQRPARHCYNGVDMETYQPIGLKRSGRFLFLARFSKIKGPDLAIEACERAEVGLDLIGDTSITNEPGYFEECKAACKGYSKIIGSATRGECVWWFSQAHALLHANMRFREPMGLAPVESQACGTPVIAWDNGAMRETILNGVTGWVVRSKKEFDDKVKEVAEMSISPKMRSDCRDWVASKFTIDMMSRRYEELCQEAIETGGW